MGKTSEGRKVSHTMDETSENSKTTHIRWTKHQERQHIRWTKHQKLTHTMDKTSEANTY